MPKPVWTDTQIIQQMDSGAHWSGNNLTYGFPSTAQLVPLRGKVGLFSLARFLALRSNRDPTPS